jgi:hypothetical protein
MKKVWGATFEFTLVRSPILVRSLKLDGVTIVERPPGIGHEQTLARS